MPLGKTVIETLHLAGWEEKIDITQAAMDQLEAQSSSAIKLFDAVCEINEIFYHPETDRWILITDGGGSFTVGAEGLLLATANPNRLDTDNAAERTMVFTIGLSDKTVGQWLVWVGAQNNYPERRPDPGFNYTS